MKFTIAIALGLVVGLIFGWVISPVEYVNTAPGTLRLDFRADYVLMAAEIYHSDHDLDQAARHLAMLGSAPPAQTAAQALQYGLQAGFPEMDIRLLQELAAALQTWQPASGGNLP